MKKRPSLDFIEEATAASSKKSPQKSIKTSKTFSQRARSAECQRETATTITATIEQLYQDVFRRKKAVIRKQRANEQAQSKLIVYMNTSSTKMLAQRLIREFEVQSQAFFPPDHEHRFNYIQTGEFLRQLKFLVYSKSLNNRLFVKERTLLRDLWQVLRGDEFNGVTERNLLQFLLSILGLDIALPKYIPLPKAQRGKSGSKLLIDLDSIQNICISDYVGSENEEGSFAHQQGNQDTLFDISGPSDVEMFGVFDEHQNIILTAGEVKRIHKVYELLYTNRVTACQTTGGIQSKEPRPSATSPKVSKLSRQTEALAETYRQKQLEEVAEFIAEMENPQSAELHITHAELIQYHHKVHKQKLQQHKEQQEMQQVDSYSFKPALNSTKNNKWLKGVLSNRLSPQKYSEDRFYQEKLVRKTEKSYEDWYDEKYLSGCTFQPTLEASKSYNTRQTSLDQVKNSEKVITRMSEAQEQRNFLQWFKGQRDPYDSKGIDQVQMTFAVERVHNKSSIGEKRQRQPLTDGKDANTWQSKYNQDLTKRYSETKQIKPEEKHCGLGKLTPCLLSLS